MRATVVGAGVSGLTCAHALARAGWEVEIVARETWQSCVSAVAAAIWSTTSVAEGDERARRWMLTSRDRFAEIAHDPTSGVVRLVQRELEQTDPGPSAWADLPFVRQLARDELPSGYASGIEIDGFMVEPPRYLPWLTARLGELGVGITVAPLRQLTEVSGDLVVNCSGLGAAELADDDSVFPIRGQVVAVPNPGIRDSISDESDQRRITYVYPRAREVILGGCRDIGSANTAPDPSLTERILADAGRLEPRVAGLEVLDVRVGLRPGRPTVRVDHGTLPDGRPVIHDYGHGGLGYILSWGCAADVVALAG